MKSIYPVTINSTENINIKAKDVINLDAIPIAKNKFHILQENRSYHAEIIENNFSKKSYTVKINNNSYQISIQNNLDTLIKEMGFELGATKKVNQIKAPMPGLILEVMVAVGQEVQEDEALIILEAMKMENVLTAPRNGKIKSISVKNGEAVEKNQLLIEFE